MLKVWRGKHHKLFAECTSCGSYGTAGHLKPKIKMSAEIEGALERHTAHMLTLRQHFTKAANTIQAQIRDGSISRKVGSDKIRDIYNNHVGQVVAAQTLLPSPDGQVKELATNCPWCGVEEEVGIETLPEDQDEPVFEQAKAVLAYIKKNAPKKKEA